MSQELKAALKLFTGLTLFQLSMCLVQLFTGN